MDMQTGAIKIENKKKESRLHLKLKTDIPMIQ